MMLNFKLVGVRASAVDLSRPPEPFGLSNIFKIVFGKPKKAEHLSSNQPAVLLVLLNSASKSNRLDFSIRFQLKRTTKNGFQLKLWTLYLAKKDPHSVWSLNSRTRYDWDSNLNEWNFEDSRTIWLAYERNTLWRLWKAFLRAWRQNGAIKILDSKSLIQHSVTALKRKRRLLDGLLTLL